MTSLPAPSRRAFSMVELAVVLGIIAAASAIALPRFWSSTGRYRVDLAARRLAADLSLAQTHARTTSQFRNVRFAAGGTQYTLTEESAINNNSGSYTVDLSQDPYLCSVTAFTVSDGGRRVVFDGYGQPDRSLSITLACAGHSRIVAVDSSSGAISVTTP